MLKLDTGPEQAMAGMFRIQSIPTMALIRNGQEFKRISGAMDARRIVDWARNP